MRARESSVSLGTLQRRRRHMLCSGTLGSAGGFPEPPDDNGESAEDNDAIDEGSTEKARDSRDDVCESRRDDEPLPVA